MRYHNPADSMSGPRYAGMHRAYPDLRDLILQYGEWTSPRGEPTLELRGFGFVIDDAVNRGVPLGCGRKVGAKMMAIDGSGNLAGWVRPGLSLAVAPVLERFSDVVRADRAWGSAWRQMEKNGAVAGKPFFQGAYGPRIGPQLLACEEQLRADPATRQAIVQLWQPQDRDPQWKDRPCTTELQFLLRDDGLHLFVQMRANDLWTGTCYDVFQFGQVQAAMAHVLDVPIGPYHHHANSLHIYQRDVEKFERVVPWSGGLFPAVDNPRESWGPHWHALPAGTYRTMADVQKAFRGILDEAEWTWDADFVGGHLQEPSNVVEQWYWERLRKPAPQEESNA
jgi:hypothetical protein